MEKDADAYRTISEVAETLNIPPHVLRFWETKFPQIKPLKRGGGRRYYRRADTELLRNIRRLLYDEGYTIRGVQRLLKAPGGVSALLNVPAPAVDLSVCLDLENGMEVETSAAAHRIETLDDREIVINAIQRIRSDIDTCRTILNDAARAFS